GERTYHPPHLDLALTPHQKVAGPVDVAAHALLRRETREVVLRHLAESLLFPGVERNHEVAGEALDQAARAEIVKTFVLQRRRERAQARLVVVQRDGPDHGAEDEPSRRLMFIGIRRPGQTPAADKPAVDAD